jgi:DNA-binding transcriptional MerR regulator
MKSRNEIQYSISELAALSGIKAHTIRIWEQRYGLLNPKRSDTQIRYYSDQDLKQLMNISLLNRKGVKISKIALLENTEMLQQVSDIETNHYTHSVVIDQLVKCMISFDEMQFEKTFNKAILQFGFQSVMLDIIYPYLEKIGLLWLTGNINPAQEHFICNLVRQKLIVAIDGIVSNYHANTKKLVLFLPAHELHELSLLFYCYYLKQQNHQIIYLGANLPNIDLQPIIDVYQPDVVMTALTSSLYIKNSKNLIEETAKKNPSILFKIAGTQAFQLSKSTLPNISCFTSLNDVLRFVP